MFSRTLFRIYTRPIVSKRFYTLDQITKAKYGEPEIIVKKSKYEKCYESLRDPTSSYSRLFANNFIDRIDNMNRDYGNYKFESKLDNAYYVFDQLTKYQTVWEKLPHQFKSEYGNVETSLNNKRNDVFNDIKIFKNNINIEKLKIVINNDLDDLMMESE
jgi:hypothetical protein